MKTKLILCLLLALTACGPYKAKQLKDTYATCIDNYTKDDGSISWHAADDCHTAALLASGVPRQPK